MYMVVRTVIYVIIYKGEQMKTNSTKKALATRLANQVSARQRKAALKAWRTRRANA